MTTKTSTPTKGVDENGMPWEQLEVFGKTYRLRAISVDESDAAYDASLNPDKTFNSRLNQRMQLTASIESPQTSVDDIGKWSVPKLLMLLRVYDRLNNLPAADTEGNDSAPSN